MTTVSRLAQSRNKLLKLHIRRPTIAGVEDVGYKYPAQQQDMTSVKVIA